MSSEYVYRLVILEERGTVEWVFRELFLAEHLLLSLLFAEPAGLFGPLSLHEGGACATGGMADSSKSKFPSTWEKESLK